MVDQAPRRRSRLLINKRLQITFLLFSVGFAAFAIGILLLEHFVVFSNYLDASNQELMGNSAVMEVVEEGRTKIRVALVISSLLILVSLVVGGLILSNRIAGPIYRLKTHMEGILRTGKIEPVAFREDDYFGDVAEVYNKLLEELKKDKAG